MSKFQYYMEALKELDVEGGKVESFEAENAGRYKKMVQKAYKLNKPLSYMELVELLQTGEIGKWGPKERQNNRGVGSMNLTGYGKTGSILGNWFDKVDGKYVPKKAKMEEVLQGNFKPWAGIYDPHDRAYQKSRRQFKRERKEEAEKQMGAGI